MAAIRARVANITVDGRRRRFLMGVAAIGLGAAAAVGLIAAGVSPGWLLILFVPFWFGALGLIQAREKT